MQRRQPPQRRPQSGRDLAARFRVQDELGGLRLRQPLSGRGADEAAEKLEQPDAEGGTSCQEDVEGAAAGGGSNVEEDEER